MACDSSSSDALTRQFYDWEKRGRGWQVWEQPVFLEPPFRPFYGHYLAGIPAAALDDGRKATFLSSLLDRVIPSVRAGAAPDSADEQEPEPTYMGADAPLVEIQIALPSETKITKDAAGQFLL